jgi:hypothetical protein
MTSSTGLATENIICADASNAATMTFLVGTTPGLAPLGLYMKVGGKKWSTKEEDGATTVTIAQSFSDDSGMRLDVADDNLERIIAELRVNMAREGGEIVFAGTLRIAGIGVWAVACEGDV